MYITVKSLVKGRHQVFSCLFTVLIDIHFQAREYILLAISQILMSYYITEFLSMVLHMTNMKYLINFFEQSIKNSPLK